MRARPSRSSGVSPGVERTAERLIAYAKERGIEAHECLVELREDRDRFLACFGRQLRTEYEVAGVEVADAGQRVEIDRDDRLYVGAWTRIVLRQATESERRGTG